MSRIEFYQHLLDFTSNPTVLEWIRSDVQSIARHLISKRINRSDVDELAYECSTRFVEMYIKHPTWRCRNFKSRIDMEVKYFLYNNKQKQLDKVVVDSELFNSIHQDEPTSPEDDRFVLQDIITGNQYWRNIFIDCYKSRTYKEFILKISKYCEKQWIYDYAKRLRLLYRYTRRDK